MSPRTSAAGVIVLVGSPTTTVLVESPTRTVSVGSPTTAVRDVTRLYSGSLSFTQSLGGWMMARATLPRGWLSMEVARRWAIR